MTYIVWFYVDDVYAEFSYKQLCRYLGIKIIYLYTVKGLNFTRDSVNEESVTK